jgi:prepilin-type N-terminal cleavage/methylation domain-containing protein
LRSEVAQARKIHPSRHAARAGMTLIELVVAMSIMAVLSVMVMTAWIALQSSFAYSSKSAQSRSSARDAMARMRREIRDAIVDPTTGDGPLVIADSNHIEFYSALNDTGGNVKLVDYWYRATSSTTGTITRKRGAGAEVVVARDIVNVTNSTPLFRYTYIDATGNPLAANTVGAASVPSILTVEIHILADVNPGRSPVYMDLISTVQPRNQRQY